jgi:hypothetical protein
VRSTSTSFIDTLKWRGKPYHLKQQKSAKILERIATFEIMGRDDTRISKKKINEIK